MKVLCFTVFIALCIIYMIQAKDDSRQYNCKDEQLVDLVIQMNKTLQTTLKELDFVVKEMEVLKREKSVGLHMLPRESDRQAPILAGTVAFYAVDTQSYILGDQQTIIFDKVVTNIGSGYDGLDGQFTAPVAGLYFFSTSIMAYPNHYIHAEMVHNGANLAYVFAARGEDDTGTAVTNVVLQQGDKVWVRHRNDPSGIAHLEPYYSTFSGFLITEDVP